MVTEFDPDDGNLALLDAPSATEDGSGAADPDPAADEAEVVSDPISEQIKALRQALFGSFGRASALLKTLELALELEVHDEARLDPDIQKSALREFERVITNEHEKEDFFGTCSRIYTTEKEEITREVFDREAEIALAFAAYIISDKAQVSEIIQAAFLEHMENQRFVQAQILAERFKLSEHFTSNTVAPIAAGFFNLEDHSLTTETLSALMLETYTAEQLSESKFKTEEYQKKTYPAGEHRIEESTYARFHERMRRLAAYADYLLPKEDILREAEAAFVEHLEAGRFEQAKVLKDRFGISDQVAHYTTQCTIEKLFADSNGENLDPETLIFIARAKSEFDQSPGETVLKQSVRITVTPKLEEKLTEAVSGLLSETYEMPDLYDYNFDPNSDRVERDTEKRFSEALNKIEALRSSYPEISEMIAEQAQLAFIEHLEAERFVQAKAIKDSLNLTDDFARKAVNRYIEGLQANGYRELGPKTFIYLARIKEEYGVDGKLPVTDAVRKGLSRINVNDNPFGFCHTAEVVNYVKCFDFTAEEKAVALRLSLEGSLDVEDYDTVLEIAELCKGAIPLLLKQGLKRNLIKSTQMRLCLAYGGPRLENVEPDPDKAQKVYEAYGITGREIISFIPWSMAAWSEEHTITALEALHPENEKYTGSTEYEDRLKAYILAVQKRFGVSDDELEAGISDVILRKADKEDPLVDRLTKMFELDEKGPQAIHNKADMLRATELTELLDGDSLSAKDRTIYLLELERLTGHLTGKLSGDNLENNPYRAAWLTQKNEITQKLEAGAKVDGRFLRIPLSAAKALANNGMTSTMRVAIIQDDDVVDFLNISDAVCLDRAMQQRTDGTVNIGFLIEDSLRDFAEEEAKKYIGRKAAVRDQASRLKRTPLGKSAGWLSSNVGSAVLGAFVGLFIGPQKSDDGAESVEAKAAEAFSLGNQQNVEQVVTQPPTQASTVSTETGEEIIITAQLEGPVNANVSEVAEEAAGENPAVAAGKDTVQS